MIPPLVSLSVSMTQLRGKQQRLLNLATDGWDAWTGRQAGSNHAWRACPWLRCPSSQRGGSVVAVAVAVHARSRMLGGVSAGPAVTPVDDHGRSGMGSGRT